MDPTADDYQREHAKWMDARTIGLADSAEAVWAAKLDALWKQLSPEHRETAQAWVTRQTEYRKEHELTHEDITPDERLYIEYAGEYELILAEDDHNVVFQIHGKKFEISRGVLLDYDEEGRFFCSMADAKKLGLCN